MVVSPAQYLPLRPVSDPLPLLRSPGYLFCCNAEFLAAVQVLIYVGAVSILMIFAVMLTSDLASKKIVQTNENALVGVFRLSDLRDRRALVLIVNTHDLALCDPDACLRIMSWLSAN